MPQMFPMSMLVLSVVVMGTLVLCIIRLFWGLINTATVPSSLSSKEVLIDFKHTW